jgi:hypothetical protein
LAASTSDVEDLHGNVAYVSGERSSLAARRYFLIFISLFFRGCLSAISNAPSFSWLARHWRIETLAAARVSRFYIGGIVLAA